MLIAECGLRNTTSKLSGFKSAISNPQSAIMLALGETCAAMEQAGKAGDMGALGVLLPEFEQELAGVEDFFDGYL